MNAELSTGPNTEFELTFDFDAYEQEVAHVDLKANALAALNDIMTIKKPDGTEKTRQEVEQEVDAFFSNEEVAKDMALLQELERVFIDMCADHGMTAEDFGGSEAISTLFSKASRPGYGSDDGHNHPSSGHSSAKTSSVKSKPSGKAAASHAKAVRRRQTSYEIWQLLLRYYRGGLFGH